MHITKLTSIIIISVTLLESSFAAAKIPSAQELNKRADILFLQWKINNVQLPADIKNILDKPGILERIATDSSLSFDKNITDKAVQKVINKITDNLMKSYKEAKLSDRSKGQLTSLISSVIKPELVMVNLLGDSKQDKAYREFMTTLSQKKTPVGTTLKQWALKFLTSQSLIMALNLIKEIQIEGARYRAMSSDQFEDALKPIVTIVAETFLDQINQLATKHSFKVSADLVTAIEQKLMAFLKQKFK